LDSTEHALTNLLSLLSKNTHPACHPDKGVYLWERFETDRNYFYLAILVIIFIYNSIAPLPTIVLPAKDASVH
jgi:hypothetical protein